MRNRRNNFKFGQVTTRKTESRLHSLLRTLYVLQKAVKLLVKLLKAKPYKEPSSRATTS
jgi:hypothetical protein